MSSQARVGALGPQEAVLALGSLSLGPGLQGNSDKHMPSSAASPTSAWQSPQIYALGLVSSLLPTPALGGRHPPFQGNLCPLSGAKEFSKPFAAFST